MDEARRRRNAKWLIAAIAAFFGSAAIAAIPVVGFATNVVPKIATVVAEIRPGETTTVEAERAGFPFVVAVPVQSRSDDVPEHQLTVTDASGAPVPTSEDTRWRSIFEKQYRNIAKITPAATGPIEISVAAEPGSAFALLHDEGAAVTNWIAWAGPVWGTAGVTLVTSIILLFCFLTRPYEPEVPEA